jgi:hypothetical protein
LIKSLVEIGDKTFHGTPRIEYSRDLETFGFEDCICQPEVLATFCLFEIISRQPPDGLLTIATDTQTFDTLKHGEIQTHLSSLACI